MADSSAPSDSDISEYLDHIRYEKRYSPNTLLSYETDLLQFRTWLKTFAQHISFLHQATHTEVRSWMAALMTDELSPRSVNRKMSALRAFFRYHHRKGTISKNPLRKIQSLRTKNTLPVFIDQKGMNLLTERIEFPAGHEGLLHKTIMETLYGTGIRRSELASMKRDNIDSYQGQIRVMGKGGKERIIPIHSELLYALQQLILASPSSEWVFVSENGKQLSANAVYAIVKKYLSLVTTAKKRSPHVLRHTFATHLLNNGADINAVKELLGHSSLAATQVYTHNTIEKLRDIHKQAHPKA